MSYPEQVGGDHYKADIQHWDLMEQHDVAYLEATASKYVTRWQKKGGSEDLRKSATYRERALVEERDARRLVPADELDAFFNENSLYESGAIWGRRQAAFDRDFFTRCGIDHIARGAVACGGGRRRVPFISRA